MPVQPCSLYQPVPWAFFLLLDKCLSCLGHVPRSFLPSGFYNFSVSNWTECIQLTCYYFKKKGNIQVFSSFNTDQPLGIGMMPVDCGYSFFWVVSKYVYHLAVSLGGWNNKLWPLSVSFTHRWNLSFSIAPIILASDFYWVVFFRKKKLLLGYWCSCDEKLYVFIISQL